MAMAGTTGGGPPHRGGGEDASAAGLEALVRRQMAMLDRYDAMVSELSRRGRGADTGICEGSMDRVLGLLDEAIARAEQMTSRNRGLESALERTLALLERSLVAQEGMAARGTVAVPAAPASAMEQTLAKYDRMLERSLAALEKSYRASQSTRKEVDERDRLLGRTLDLLQAAVDDQQAAPPKSGMFGRLFS